MQPNNSKKEIWDLEPIDALASLQSGASGLSEEKARRRYKNYEADIIKPKKKVNAALLFLAQFKTIFHLILLVVAVFAFFLGDAIDVYIIFIILLISGVLGFIQEKGALDIIADLIKLVETTVTTLRDNEKKQVNISSIVPGDIIFLNAGDIIPADCVLLEGKDLFVDEATLTGESLAVEKLIKDESKGPILKRKNVIFMGCHVISGTGKALVFRTGKATEFGKISQHISVRPPETSYEKDLKHFSYLLVQITFVFVIAVFAFNVFFRHPFLESLLFALALSIGFTPQLLPMIITVNLARGAKIMAKSKVVVKKLSSIETFGSMDVLCTDKTGTLTEGVVKFYSSLDSRGKESLRTHLFGYINASYQTGYVNPIDQAILKNTHPSAEGFSKLDEIPYDFIRKRVSVLAQEGDKSFLITKGDFKSVLNACSQVEIQEDVFKPIDEVKESLIKVFSEWGEKGYRVLGLAYKILDANKTFTKEDEKDLIFLGFLLFYDPPKDDCRKTLEDLKNMGITLKMITGDNFFVAKHVAEQVGIPTNNILLGADIANMSDTALRREVWNTDIFAEIDPIEKERIIVAIKFLGKSVGYLGDGLNDAPALHVADVSISVNSAADFIKECADIVLIDKSLSVLLRGVKEGRNIFANIMKYVLTAASGNFGNMFSMTLISPLLPFIPLLPKQILLNNLLTDIPEMTISTDNVDPEMQEKPWRWDIKFMKKFFLVFGLTSSIFDFVTFGILIFIFKATEEQFRTAWFIESVMTASLVVLFIRTRRFFLKSIPSKYLMGSLFLMNAFTILLPWTGLAKIFSLVPLSFKYFVAIFTIVSMYVVVVEVVKKFFYKKYLGVNSEKLSKGDKI